MKLLLFSLMLTAHCFAQDLSSPEFDYYQESPVNEEEFNHDELREIYEEQEDLPYYDDYEESQWNEDEQRELQELEQDYVE